MMKNCGRRCTKQARQFATSPPRLVVLGSSLGKGHPYSWSEIVNGYNPARADTECPFRGASPHRERIQTKGIDRY
jgi:hypothetical protein